MKKVYYIALVLTLAGFGLIFADYSFLGVLALWVSFVMYVVVYCSQKKEPKEPKPTQERRKRNRFLITTWWFLENNS